MSEDRIGRPKACPKRGQGLPERCAGAATECAERPVFAPATNDDFSAPTLPQAICLLARPRLSWGHDGAFPLPEHLCGAAGELFRPRGADPGGRAAADQAEPAAGGPSRARSGPARQPGRRRNPRRQAPARRRRPDRDGLCRPPVRPFRAAARRRPRHPARRGHRHRRRPPRHPAQGLRPDAVLAPRRRPRGARPGAARIHRQRGDGRARHSDHALARCRDHRRKRDARDAAARRGAHPRRREPHPRRHVPVFRRARRYRRRAAARRSRHRAPLSAMPPMPSAPITRFWKA